MKTPRLLAALGAACVLAVAARAADVSGTWKWTSQTKSGPTEITAVLQDKNGTLTGTVTTRQGPAEIAAASVQGSTVSFTVTRSSGVMTTVFHYSGTLAGDTITGTIVRTGPNKDAPPVTTDWKAARAK